MVFAAILSMEEQSDLLVLLFLWEEKKIIRMVLRENFGGV